MVKLRKSQRAIKEGAGYTFKWTTHKDDGIGKETGIGTRPRPRPRRPFADVISTEQWDTTLRTQCVSSSSSSSSFYQVPPQQQFHSSLPFTGNTPTEWTKLFFFFFFKEKGGNDGSARLGSFFTPSEKGIVLVTHGGCIIPVYCAEYIRRLAEPGRPLWTVEPCVGDNVHITIVYDVGFITRTEQHSSFVFLCFLSSWPPLDGQEE